MRRIGRKCFPGARCNVPSRNVRLVGLHAIASGVPCPGRITPAVRWLTRSDWEMFWKVAKDLLTGIRNLTCGLDIHPGIRNR